MFSRPPSVGDSDALKFGACPCFPACRFSASAFFENMGNLYWGLCGSKKWLEPTPANSAGGGVVVVHGRGSIEE